MVRKDKKDTFKKALLGKPVVVSPEDKIIVEQQEIIRQKSTLFQSATVLKKHHEVLFFIIVTTALVMLIRGLWNILDRFWFPDLPLFSAISGIVIGIAILFLMREALSKYID